MAPWRLTAGIAWTSQRVSLALDVDYSPAFTAFQGAAIAVLDQEPEPLINRRALWNVRAGAYYAWTSRWDIGAGAFTDRSPERRPNAFPEMQVDFFGVTLGVRSRQVVILDRRERSDSLVLSTTVALRYAVGFGEASNVVFDLSDLAERLRIPGESNVQVRFHEAAVHIGTALLF